VNVVSAINISLAVFLKNKSGHFYIKKLLIIVVFFGLILVSTGKTSAGSSIPPDVRPSSRYTSM